MVKQDDSFTLFTAYRPKCKMQIITTGHNLIRFSSRFFAHQTTFKAVSATVSSDSILEFVGDVAAAESRNCSHTLTTRFSDSAVFSVTLLTLNQ